MISYLKHAGTTGITLLCFFYSGVFAQQTITGKLVNEYKRPVEQATLILKLQDKHAHSDENGFFKLETNGNQDTIIIQHSEYETLYLPAASFVPGRDIMLASKPVELEEVTITGIKPSFSYISRVDINTRPILNSQDLLRIVPGLFIAQHAGGGKAEQIFLRGFDIDHGTDIALTVDGMPVNMVSHAHGQGYADMHFVIPELVKDIDYGKGPYYAGKGNLNTAGYADFQTIDKPVNSRVQLEAGKFNTARALMILDLSPKDNPDHYGYVASEFNYTDGPFISYQNFNRLNVQGKYSFKLTDKTRLNLLASSFRSKWDASGQIPLHAVDSGYISKWGSLDDTEGGATSRTNLSVSLQTQLSPYSYFRNQIYYSKYDFNLFSNFTFFLNDTVNGDMIEQKESRNIYGYTGSHHYMKDLGLVHWNQTTGAGFRYDQVQEIGLFNAVQRRRTGILSYGDVNETNGFAYIDERFTIGKFIVNPALRIDGFRFEYNNRMDSLYRTQSVFQAVLLPKLNILFNARDNFQLYIKAGKGFHSNDTRVVVAQQGEQILPAAYGTDLGTNFKIGKKFIANVAAWYLFLEQEFVFVGDEAIVEPSGRTERRGLDVSGRLQLFKWLTLDSDVNVAMPKALDVPEEESYIPLAPRFTSSGGITFGLKRGFNGGIRYRHLADRAADETNTLTAKGYTVFDASLNYTKEKYQVMLSVLNLFDVDWREAQFATESRIFRNGEAVTDIHFTPGIPFFAKAGLAYFF